MGPWVRSVLLGVTALAAGCTPTAPTGDCDGGTCPDAPPPPRLFVSPPFGVGYDCVRTSCDTVQVLTAENRGTGVVRLLRVALTSTSSQDFHVEAVPMLPLDLRQGTPLEISVRYTPTDAVADEGAVRITYELDPPQGPAPEPVVMALRTRSLGSPHAQLAAPELNFGYVAPGESLTKEIELKNISEAGSILAVTDAVFMDESDAAFHILSTFPIFANNGESARVRVRFSPALDPSSIRTFKARVHLATNDGANPDIPVDIIGTARQDPAIDVELPGFSLDVGSVGVGGMLQKTFTVRNVGGQDLNVSPQLEGAAGSGFTVEPALGSLPPVHAFERATVIVHWTAMQGGSVMGTGGTVPVLRLLSNDPERPEVRITLEGFGILPTATPNVDRLDFGGVVVGWNVEPRPLTVRNTGAGPLHITDVFMEPGSSSQFRRDPVPGLPKTLMPEDPPLAINVYYAPVALGDAHGVLVIQSDDPSSPLKRVSVLGHGMTCEEGCPILHAVPRCSAGKCEIESCNGGFHNADEVQVNGCECGEDSGGEVGAVCGGGERNLGTFKDSNGTETNVSGTLHAVDDQDTYWMYAEDDGGVGELFGDSFDFRINLVNPLPGIEFCIRTSAHDVQGQGCGRGDEICGQTSFRKDGSYGTEDATDATVRVRLTPGTAPFCASYTLHVKNG